MLRYWYYLAPVALLAVILWFQPAERPVGIGSIPGYPLYGVATRWLTDDCDTLAYVMRAENAARGRKAGLLGPVWFDKATGLHGYDPRHPERYERRENAPFEQPPDWPPAVFESRLADPTETPRPRYFLEYPPLALWLFRLGLVGAPGANADVSPALLDAHQVNVGYRAPATRDETVLYARFRHALRVYAVLMTLAQLGLMLLLDFGLPAGLGRVPTWLLILPGFLYYTPCRFDILPAALVAASLIAADRRTLGMTALSGLLLGLAVGLKMYPLVLAPILLRYVATDWKRFAVWCACGAVPVVASYGIFYLTDGIEGATVPLRFQLARDPETGWCFYGDLTAEDPPDTPDGKPGWHLTGKLLPMELTHKTLPATLLRTLPVLIVALLGSVRRPPDLFSLLRRCTLALLAFLALSVFFSPQWWQWLAVLVVPLAARHRWLVPLIVANDLWTFLHFPLLFDMTMFGGLGDSARWVTDLHVLTRGLLWLGLAGGLVWEEVRALRRVTPATPPS